MGRVFSLRGWVGNLFGQSYSSGLAPLKTQVTCPKLTGMSTCRGISFLCYLLFCPLPYNKCHRTCVVWDPLCRRGTRAFLLQRGLFSIPASGLHSTTHFLHFFLNLCNFMTFPLCYFSALCHIVYCVQGALSRAYAVTEHRQPTTVTDITQYEFQILISFQAPPLIF